MSPRIFKILGSFRESLWVIPAVCLFIGLLAGVLVPWVDSGLELDERLPEGWALGLMDASPSGAREVLSSSATALATILGVVFSITVVTLQLAAGQYGPRILRKFSSDRFNHWSLGALLGTVTYLLLVLRVVRSEGDEREEMVPALATLLGMLATLGCLLVVALFIHHVARSIQAGTIVADIGKETIKVFRNLSLGDGAGRDEPPGEVGERTEVLAERAGHLLYFSEDRLFAALPTFVTDVRMEISVGDFALPGTPLLSFRPPRPLDEAGCRRVREVLAFGRERTPSHDVLFGVRQLVDVALRALSPSLNDPTTAVAVVNELGVLLCEAVRSDVHGTRCWRICRRGNVTLSWPVFGLRELLHSAYGEMAEAGRDQPRVMARMLEVLAQTSACARSEDQRAVLLQFGAMVYDLVKPTSPATRDMVDELFHRLRRVTLGGEHVHPGTEPTIQ